MLLKTRRYSIKVKQMGQKINHAAGAEFYKGPRCKRCLLIKGKPLSIYSAGMARNIKLLGHYKNMIRNQITNEIFQDPVFKEQVVEKFRSIS